MQPVTTSGFRPSIDAKLERKSLHVTEYRLAAGMTRIAGFMQSLYVIHCWVTVALLAWNGGVLMRMRLR